MKKLLAMLLCISMMFTLAACGNNGGSTDSDDDNQNAATEEAYEETVTEEAEENYTPSELKEEIQAQDCHITKTKYVVQSEEYKALYQDLIIGKALNNTGETIKDLRIAFAAWDEDGLPIILDDDEYVVIGKFNGVNLKDGDTLDDQGLPVDSDLAERGTIKKCKSIVVSYEDFSGNKWENPLFENWKSVYEGKELN